jgi:hypothetical protein
MGLLDALNDDLIWRKKEITAYKLAVGNKESGFEKQRAFMRAALTMLYAHWEGFVRQASELYVQHVALQRLRHDQLSVPFLAQAFRRVLAPASLSGKSHLHQDAVRFITENLGRQASLTHLNVISAKSNLSSAVLREIVETLGLDYKPYQVKERFIDNSLVERRNMIAHGEYLSFDIEECLDCIKAVENLLEAYKDDVFNAASIKAYLR